MIAATVVVWITALERHRLQLSDLKVKTGYVNSTNLPHDGYNQARFERLPMPEQFL